MHEPPVQLMSQVAPVEHDCRQPPPSQLNVQFEDASHCCEQSPPGHSKVQVSPAAHAQSPDEQTPEPQAVSMPMQVTRIARRWSFISAPTSHGVPSTMTRARRERCPVLSQVCM